MAFKYQSLLGLSEFSGQQADVDDMTVRNELLIKSGGRFHMPEGAVKGEVLTCDDNGVASWELIPETVLAGDASGPSSANVVNTLAGGTIPVENVVLLDKEQTLTNKTLTVPKIASVANVGTILNMPELTDTLVARATVDTLSNKTITGTSNSVDANTLRSGSTYAVPLGGVAPVVNDILSYNGTNAVWQSASAVNSLGGDASGPANANVVNTLAGGTIPVDTLAQLYAVQTLANKTVYNPVFTGTDSRIATANDKFTNNGQFINNLIVTNNSNASCNNFGSFTNYANGVINNGSLFRNGFVNGEGEQSSGVIDNTYGTINGGAITGAALTDCTISGVTFPSSTFNNPTFTGDSIVISPLSGVQCHGSIGISGDYSGINNFGFYYTQAGGNMDNNGTFYNTAKFVNRYNTGFMWNAGTFTNNWDDSVNNNGGYYGFKGGVIDNSGGTIKNGTGTGDQTKGIFDNTYGTISGGAITGVNLTTNNVTIAGGTITATNLSNIALASSAIQNSSFSDGTITGGNISGALTSTGILYCNNQIQNQVICLYQEGGSPSPDSTSYYGLGVNGGVLRYQVPGSSTHKFYADTNQLAILSSSGLQLSGGLTLPSSGGTASPLNYYEEYTHVTTFTFGSQATTAATFRVVRVGKLVTMTMLTGSQYVDSTSSNHFYSAVNLPMRFVGGVGVMVPIVVITGGLYATGSFSLDNQAGAIAIHLSYGQPFPASSNVGFIAFTSSWCI